MTSKIFVKVIIYIFSDCFRFKKSNKKNIEKVETILSRIWAKRKDAISDMELMVN